MVRPIIALPCQSSFEDKFHQKLATAVHVLRSFADGASITKIQTRALYMAASALVGWFCVTPAFAQTCPSPAVVNNTQCTVPPGTTLTVTTAGTTGLNANGQAGQITGDGAIIRLGGATTTGALAQGGGTISLSGSTVITASAAPSGQVGVRAVGVGSTITGAGSTITIVPVPATKVANNMIGVLAEGGGTIEFTNTSVTSSSATNGIGNYGLVSDGVGSRISFTGGSVTTSSRGAFSVLARNGGVVALDGGTQVSSAGMQNTATLAYSHALYAQGAGSSISATGITVTATGTGGNAARAEDGAGLTITNSTFNTSGAGSAIEPTAVVRVTSGGQAQITGSMLNATGASGHGVFARDVGTSVQITNTQMKISGYRAVGMHVLDGATARVEGSTIHLVDNLTTQRSLHGITVDNVGSELTLINSDIITETSTGHGVRVNSGAVATILGGSITTGALRITNPAHLTTGVNASALQSSGGARITATNVTLATYGDGNSMGATVDMGGYIELIGGSVTTYGSATGLQENDARRPHGVMARRPGAVLVVTGTRIETHGLEGFGAVADDGAIVTLNDLSVKTLGQRAIGLYSIVENPGAGNLASITSNTITVETFGEMATGALVHQGFYEAPALLTLNDSTVTTHGNQAAGLAAGTGGTLVANRSTATTEGTDSYGAFARSNPSSVTLVDSRVRATGAFAHGALAQDGGRINGTGSSVIATGASASALYAVSGPDLVSLADFTASTLTNVSGPTIGVAGNADITLTNSVAGGSGQWLQVGTVDDFPAMPVRPSSLTPGLANINLFGSTVTGTAFTAPGSVSNVTLAANSIWNMTGDSNLTNLINDFSQILYSAPTNGVYKTLTVDNDYSGVGAALIALNTTLNAGGSLPAQATDRLIINGNATGATRIMVHGSGNGAYTSAATTSLNNEGISLVQVAGTSTEAAFALANPGGYVAAGPFQYRLYAYGPGASAGVAAAEQNLTTNTAGTHWDYRLQNPYVVPPVPPENCEALGTCQPTPPPAKPERPTLLVPQAPTYINLPTAMMHAGFQDIDMLHRRLGELHDDNPNALNRAGRDQTDGESFVRVYGGMFDYDSNRSYNQYGYNSDVNYVALQVGSNVFSHRNENAITRVGFALTFGTMSMETNSPNVFEGRSKATVNTYSLQGYMTRQWDSGFYIDSVLSYGLFEGDISSYAISNVGDVSGNTFAAGIEIGRPWHFAEKWTLEPQLQLVYLRASFNNSTHTDGVVFGAGSPQQLVGRVGGRLTRAFRTDDNQLITPYAKLNLIHGFLDSSDVSLSGTTFASGDYGTALQIGGGMTGTLDQNWSLYADAAWQRSLHDGGFGGWVANAGVRYVW